MQAKETTLEHLLEGQKQYLVPLYQRTYAWRREQLHQLWADVLVQADALRDGATGPGHFVGSVVLSPAPGTVAGGLQRWVVVDGQQRLTTLLLALAAIRDHVRPEQPQAAEQVHEQCLVNKWQSGDDHQKLLPTQTDRTAFRAYIDPHSHASSGGNVADAYNFFQQQIVAVDDPEDPHDVQRIEQAIRHRLDIVAITADRADNVHRIFESLNNTGMQLSMGDLLRNYLFMLLPKRGAEVYDKVWRPMQDMLGTENIEILAYLDLQLRGHPEAHRRDTYREQQHRLQPIEHDEAAIEAEIVELARRAHHLRAILDPSTVTEKDLSQALRRLADWGGEAVHPVLMVLLDRRERGVAASGEAVDGATYLESYLVRRMLCGRTASGLNRTLAQAALATARSDDAAAALREFLSQPRRVWPDDEQLATGIAERNFYWSGKAAQRRFVLRRLEESYGHKEPVDWNSVKVQVEHVLPQTPTPEWLDMLAPDVEPGESPSELHQRIVHRLGNLTLTAYNPDLSNQSFDQKRAVLADSHFSLAKEIAAHDSWGAQQIEERGRALAERAIALWPGPVRVQPSAPADQWQVVRQICAALPEGTWTSYGDIAGVTGFNPRSLGNYLATTPTPNAWRVLRADGAVAPDFRWLEPGRDDDPRDVLAGEGVRFDEKGRADSVQRLRPVELAALLGLDVPEDPATTDSADSEQAQRFWIQLAASQPPAVVEAVRNLLNDWRARGGSVWWGSGDQVSAFPSITGASGELYWPWAVKPVSGSVEVVFQHLTTRPPFDDTALRDELRERINRIPGVDLPASRLGLRPSFPVDLITGTDGFAAARDVHAWFLDQVPVSAATPVRGSADGA